ncbi:hypothetical protein [Amycolatopsis sp. 195334CR]|uniref:hypothetical protein n=1 Tax=Amycolatopsis sp. 195334CR TaxID=2814588 RepID=UPI001A8FC097|nr:hypothetical protein [Amycolatopsis sp. 195334CR]MBN6039859.1 hypothetical protein [Amycolatopsis sp. 195334CR]
MTLNPIEQNELLGEITKTLTAAAPAGWQRLIFDFLVLGRQASPAFAARLGDGSVQQVRAPKEVSQPLSRLRKGMYAEGLGTWFSLRLVIDPPATFHAKFDRDNEPAFGVPPAADQYVLEQERFYRSEQNLPDWFRAKLR